MQRATSLIASFLLLPGCSFVLDFDAGAPCASPADCADGYRCALGHCVEDSQETCGDFVVDSGELCDDGNDDSTDACLATCANAICGDGFLQTGVEECDDGNHTDGDGCDSNCTPTACGNTIVTTGEECDDGNRIDTDTCTNACTTPRCGDSRVTGSEQCDDGNSSNTDACTNACRSARCGDGYVRAGVEACDDGNATNGDGCDSNCTVTACGNGIVTSGEECDGSVAHGTCSSCTISCTGTWDNCDGVSTNGCESDLLSDGQDCGTCGFSCYGGSCVGSVCQPYAMIGPLQYGTLHGLDNGWLYWSDGPNGSSRTLHRTTVDGATTETVGSNLETVFDVAFTSNYVFYAEGGTAHRWIIANGIDDQVASIGNGIIQSVTTDATRVFWAENAVNQCTIKGRPLTLATSGGSYINTYVGNCDDLYVNTIGQLFWVDDLAAADNKVYRLTFANPPAVVMASGERRAADMTPIGAFLYWSNWIDGNIKRIQMTGGTPTTVISGENQWAFGLILVDGYVMWADNYGGRIRRAQFTGTTAETYIDNQPSVRGLAADATFLFWMNEATTPNYDNAYLMRMVR